jgi:O-antigen/teichoic acid export membrane protein
VTELQSPPQATGTLQALRSTKDRSAALYVLQAFIWLLAVIPARLVFKPIGYFGSPASIVGLLAMSLWACGAVRSDLLVRKVVAVRVAVVVFWLPTLISYAVLHLNSVPSDEVNAADRWLLFGLVWSGVLLLAAEGLRSRDEVMRLLRMVVAAGSFSAAVALMQSRLNFDLTKYMQKLPLLSTDGDLASVLSRAGLNRPAGTATHPIEFGCMLCMVLGFALVLAFYDKGWDAKRRWSVLFLVGLAIPMSVSRSAILGGLIVLAFWLVRASKSQRRQTLVACFFGAVAVFLTSPGLLGTLKSYFVNVTSDDSITTRTDDYAAVAKYIRRSPLIGRGPATFLPKYRILDNTWLTFSIELGLLGVVGLLIFFTTGARLGGVLRRTSNDPMTRAIGQAFIGLSVLVIINSATFDFFAYPMAPGFIAILIGIGGALTGLARDERAADGDGAVASTALPMGDTTTAESRVEAPPPSPRPRREIGRADTTSSAPDRRPDQSGRRRVTTGAALKWSLIAQFLARAGQFGLGLVLARLLTPHEFGTYTVALGVFLILLTIDDLGVVKGLVRWPGRFADVAPTARTIGVVTGVGVYAAAFALAPVIADIASTPKATAVIRVLSLGVIIDSSIQIVPAASLQRTFRQDLWVIVELSRIVVLATVTIVLASRGVGVWSLVWGSLAGQVALTTATTLLARVPIRYGFDRQMAKELIRISAPYSLAALVSAALLNVDYLVIGHRLGTVAVGIYLIAFNVSSWPTTLVGQAVRAVSIPSFSQLRQSGGDVGANVRRALVLLFAGALPFVAVLIAMPQLAIATLYGTEWVGGATALHFLALLSIVRLIDGLTDDVFFACGHSGWILAKNLVWVVLLIVGLNIGAHLGGIRGVGIGHAVVAVGVVLPMICYLLARLGMWRRQLLFVAVVMMMAAAVAGTAGWFVVHHVAAPRLVLATLGVSAVCIVYAVLLTPMRRVILGRRVVGLPRQAS